MKTEKPVQFCSLANQKIVSPESVKLESFRKHLCCESEVTKEVLHLGSEDGLVDEKFPKK